MKVIDKYPPFYIDEVSATSAIISVQKEVELLIQKGTLKPDPLTLITRRRCKYITQFEAIGTREEIEEVTKEISKRYKCYIVRWTERRIRLRRTIRIH